jgi:hypothetical protein
MLAVALSSIAACQLQHSNFCQVRMKVCASKISQLHVFPNTRSVSESSVCSVSMTVSSHTTGYPHTRLFVIESVVHMHLHKLS